MIGTWWVGLLLATLLNTIIYFPDVRFGPMGQVHAFTEGRGYILAADERVEIHCEGSGFEVWQEQTRIVLQCRRP